MSDSNFLDKMVDNFDVNTDTFKVGDKVKLSTISYEWDEVRYERLKDNTEYEISSEYFSNHIKPQQWVGIKDTENNLYYPSWCFKHFNK